jgi:pimeloyl-ACP methyl ester carboxylesterase
MAVRTVRANGIEIWTEDFGSPRDPALLLVMGASAQALLWPDEFCASLASAGRHVIRYDNRDTGQSTCFDFATSPYTLADMARDAVGVLDALDVERAHVVGASMGGMIGQTLAIEHGARLRTLTSIMSSPSGASIMKAMLGGGGSALPGPEPKVMAAAQAAAANPPRTTAERIDAAVRLWRALSGSGEPFDEAAIRERESQMQARAKNPDAAQNHQFAIAASPDRDESLRRVTTPTLVIHGSEDPILPLPHGRATAEAIPGAKLLVIEGMGHDIPPRAQKRITQAIVEHTESR